MKANIKKAVELMGGQTALANAIGVNQASVWNWINRDQKISLERAFQIEEATQGKVLATDFYPEYRKNIA